MQKCVPFALCLLLVLPVEKAGFIVGGEYGRGGITCRTGENFKGRRSAPAMFALGGGSVGLQIGREATDFVLLVMNTKALTRHVQQGQVGRADASAAAGPVSRTTLAETMSR